jgi:hypothetical protein
MTAFDYADLVNSTTTQGRRRVRRSRQQAEFTINLDVHLVFTMIINSPPTDGRRSFDVHAQLTGAVGTGDIKGITGGAASGPILRAPI